MQNTLAQANLFSLDAIFAASLPTLRAREYVACRVWLAELHRSYQMPCEETKHVTAYTEGLWRQHCCRLPKDEHSKRTRIGYRQAEAIKRRYNSIIRLEEVTI